MSASAPADCEEEEKFQPLLSDARFTVPFPFLPILEED